MNTIQPKKKKSLLKKILIYLGIFIGFIILLLLFPPNFYELGLKEYNNKNYADALIQFKYVEQDDKNYESALIKIVETNSIIDSLEKLSHSEKQTIPIIKTDKALKSKLANISEMMEEMGDYSTQNQTFKILSERPLHIQVSPQITKDDLEYLVKEQIIRTFVYVAYSTFARLDIDEITITVVPVVFDLNNPTKVKEYNNRYKLTHKINRSKAKEVMKKYIKTDNFDDLLGAEINGIYEKSLNSKKLDQLKSLKENILFNVYIEIIKK